MAILGLLLLLSQSHAQVDPVRASEFAAMVARAKDRAAAAQQTDFASGHRKHFEARFNKLIGALKEFTDDYNSGKGQVWPHKKAAALEQAFRELQATESWKRAAQDAVR